MKNILAVICTPANLGSAALSAVVAYFWIGYLIESEMWTTVFTFLVGVCFTAKGIVDCCFWAVNKLFGAVK